MNREDFETLVQQYRETKKEGQVKTWELADIAKEVATWGKGSLERFGKAADENTRTLKTYAYIARQYDPELRFQELTFKHHMVVAQREDRYVLLQEAVDFGMTAAALHRKYSLRRSTLGSISKVYSRSPIDKVIELLNAVHKIDPELLPHLMSAKAEYSDEFARMFPEIAANAEMIGNMAFLNIALSRWGYIQPILKGGELIGFKRWEG